MAVKATSPIAPRQITDGSGMAVPKNCAPKARFPILFATMIPAPAAIAFRNNLFIFDVPCSHLNERDFRAAVEAKVVISNIADAGVDVERPGFGLEKTEVILIH